MMGWDEIFQPDLPQEVVIHSWRGPEHSLRRQRKAIRAFSRRLLHDRSSPTSSTTSLIHPADSTSQPKLLMFSVARRRCGASGLVPTR